MTVANPDTFLRAAQEFAALVRPGARICLVTHVNPDGDGLGSEVAMLHLLRARGAEVSVTNPDPHAAAIRLPLRRSPRRGSQRPGGQDHPPGRRDHRARHRRSVAPRQPRAGRSPNAACRWRASTITSAPGTLPPGPRLVDPTAAATGELVAELAHQLDWPIPLEAARALYVALVTDTGGFRFSNTRPHTLRMAADLLEAGVDPEQIYLDVYAGSPEGRPRLLADVLQTLVVEVPPGLAWVTVPPGALERHGVDPDDLDGVVEHARSIRGVRLALLFREMSGGRIKVSFRSVGDVDVAELARRFGGGGHAKAAGAAISGTMAEVQQQVLAAAREFVAQT